MAKAIPPGTGTVPVLRDIVELRTGPDGERVAVPVDLDQLTDRIIADLVPRLRNELRDALREELHRQLDASVEHVLNNALQNLHHQVQRTLLAQLVEPDT